MRVIHLRFFSLLIAVGGLFSQNSAVMAGFGITTVSGATQTSAPSSVLPGASEHALPIIFAEVLGGTLNAPLAVDHNGSNIVSPGPAVGANSVVNSSLVAATLPTGTMFNSYLFHFDPKLCSDPFYISTIAFDSRIIGVQLFSSGYDSLRKPLNTPYIGTLEAGDLAVGGSIAYPTGVAYRGLDEDEFALAISNNRISLMGIALGGQIDQIRIFTAVPEPTTFVVWGFISLTCGVCAYYRRNFHGSK